MNCNATFGGGPDEKTPGIRDARGEGCYFGTFDKNVTTAAHYAERDR